MNLTEIITQIRDFNRTQSIGLNILFFLALREQTTVTHQYEEIGFHDIPQQIVTLCDRLNDDELLDLAGRIVIALVMEKNTAALEEENAQSLVQQEVDRQKQPTLLSDY